VLAGGVISALLDHTCGMAVWTAMDAFQPIATLDMRIDYLRAASKGRKVFAHASVFRMTRSVAFVRGIAHDGDAEDPVAAVQAAFMLNSDGGRKAGANLKGVEP
jgi:acyl-coenzyme A thioesterase PaaI-like protein